MRQDLEGTRDQEAYHSICKQVEREENLNSFRLNLTLIVNIALGTGFITQLQSSSNIFLKILALSGLSFAGVIFTIYSGLSIWAGRKQISYLKEQFFLQKESKFKGLVRPFFWTNSDNDAFRERLWDRAPIIITMFWAIGLFLGILVTFLVPVSSDKEIKCRPSTMTSSSSAPAPAAMSPRSALPSSVSK